MKAWLSRTAGGPESLTLEEIAEPALADDQLRVRIAAVGVNFPDSLLIRDLYQVRPDRPFVPGSEFCGVVEAIGPAAGGFRPGDLVIGRCGWGAMAERIAIDPRRCHVIPSDTPREPAAGFLFAYATAYHALRDCGDIRPGETLLVLGAAGGAGSAAVEVGCALGARVLVAVSSQDKLDFALARGASGGIVYPASLAEGAGQKALAADFKRLVGPQGADLVFDPVGGAYCEPALRCLAPLGRHLVIGFTAGIPRVPLNLALLNGRRIVGVDWRSFVARQPEHNERNVASLLALWREGAITPEVTERFGFDAVPAAISRLETRQAMGKIVVTLPA